MDDLIEGLLQVVTSHLAPDGFQSPRTSPARSGKQEEDLDIVLEHGESPKEPGEDSREGMSEDAEAEGEFESLQLDVDDQVE